MKKLFLPAILLLSAAGWAQKATPLEAEFAKLKADYAKANEAYYAPYANAKTEEESAKIRLDPAKMPSKIFLPKFKAFAKKAGNKDIAAQAWMEVFSLSSEMYAFDKLVSTFPNSSVIPNLVSNLQYSFWEDGPKRIAKIVGLLDRIDKATTNVDNKAAVLYVRAKLIADEGKGDVKAASSLLDQLIAKYPKSKQAASAKADMSELQNLSVGCMAPDIEATDENGVSFKLSDYRGKVVVLDFWGFW